MKGTKMNENLMSVAAYQVEAKFELATVELMVEAVQNGDSYGAAQRIVAERKIGPKWTDLRDGDGQRIARLENGTVVQVLRKRQTNSDAQYRARRNLHMIEALATRSEAFSTATQRFADYLTDFGYAHAGRLEDVISTSADKKVLDEFAHLTTLVQAEGYSGDFEGDLVDLLVRFRERLTTQLVSTYRQRALSRSTSQVSNLVEDAEREAVARFLDNSWWMYAV